MAITEAAINEVAGEEGTEALRHRQADDDRVRELDAHFVCRLWSRSKLLKEDPARTVRCADFGNSLKKVDA